MLMYIEISEKEKNTIKQINTGKGEGEREKENLPK
jgi:hypothetical protein